MPSRPGLGDCGGLLVGSVDESITPNSAGAASSESPAGAALPADASGRTDAISRREEEAAQAIAALSATPAVNRHPPRAAVATGAADGVAKFGDPGAGEAVDVDSGADSPEGDAPEPESAWATAHPLTSMAAAPNAKATVPGHTERRAPRPAVRSPR